MGVVKSVIDMARDEIIEKLDETYAIPKLIVKRRRQLLVHSIIYYEMNDSMISDAMWTKWAIELENLQKKYPEIAKHCLYAKEFEGFDHSTGYHLPLNDPWGVRKARELIAYRDKHIFEPPF